MLKFHERFQQLIKTSGKTQAKLAKEIDLTPQAFSYYVNGREPSYDILINISKLFNTTTDYLLGLSDDPQRQPSAVDKLGLTPAARDIIENNTNMPPLGELISGIVENDKFFYVQFFLGLALDEKERSLNYDESIFNEYRRQAELTGGVLLAPDQAIAYYIGEAKRHLLACIDNCMDQALINRQEIFESIVLDEDDD